MNFPIGNIITAVATVFSVVIANKLSSSQSGHAKLWDLRRQTYGVILSELASVERLCAVVASYLEEDLHRYFESDERTSHNARIYEHMATVRQRFSDDYLIVSTEFLTIFEAFLAELEDGSPYECFPEEDERFANVIRKHRQSLLVQGRAEIAARQDFNISGWLSQLVRRLHKP